ncbi:MAG: aldo/keto reductase [Bacilli bacterium]|nr:aldo/keto reductase [Bacilli bacterium]MDD4076934.1 aldo/keto reductase [Bacilli bacterium]MDD4388085.1 aldo/keto reductase [Bacilli bacterium]
MEYRKWYDQDINTSLLGFGAMRLKTHDGEIDEEKAMALIDYAYYNGVNYFDTAMPYTNGKNESFLGKALKRYPRDSFYLATKMSFGMINSREEALNIIDKQLANLQTNYIDMYLLHALNKNSIKRVEEWNVLDIVERWKQEGKIRNIGFSFHDDYETFIKILDMYNWDFSQIQLNYMDTDFQQGIKGYYDLEERGIPTVIMEPLKGGKLAHFHESIEKIFKEYSDDSIASWAFRWVGSLPGVKVILSGMNEMDQVIDNIKTFSVFKPITIEEEKRIDQVKAALYAIKAVDCTACRYCMPCTAEIDIPRFFALYNMFSMYGDIDDAKWRFDQLKKGSSMIDKCIECGKCVKQCPQKIDVPLQLKKMAKIMDFLF